MQNKWDREAESKVALSVAACEVLVPKSSRIALLIQEWKAAMQSEFDALAKNQT